MGSISRQTVVEEATQSEDSIPRPHKRACIGSPTQQTDDTEQESGGDERLTSLRIVNPDDLECGLGPGGFSDTAVSSRESRQFQMDDSGTFRVPMFSPRISPRLHLSDRELRSPPAQPVAKVGPAELGLGEKESLKRRTAVHDAIQSGDLKTFRSILPTMAKEDLEARDEQGYTALLSAAADPDPQRAVDFTSHLLDVGANIHMCDTDGYTALHWAAASGNAEVIAILVNAGASVHSQSHNGDTALHQASRFAQVNCIHALLEKFSAPTGTRNDQHKTPMEVAGQYCASRSLSRKRTEAARLAFFKNVKHFKTLVLHHDECLGHRTSKTHQEAPERCVVILGKVVRSIPAPFLHVSSNFPAVTKTQLLYAHDAKYIDFVFDLHNKVAVGSTVPFTPRVQVMHGVGRKDVKDELGCDTFFSKGSLPAALRAAGAVCNAVDRVVTGYNRNAFCIVRPPGHHAGISGLLHNAVSCGFCIFNNIAIGAVHALHRFPQKIRRVAIVDFDVHHGNGTEEIVRKKIRDPKSVYFFSVHLYDKASGADIGTGEFYPGSGGKDDLEMNIVNAPIAPLWHVPSTRTRSRSPVQRHSADPGNMATEEGANSGTHATNGHDKGTTASTKTRTTSNTLLDATFGRQAFRQKIVEKLIPSLTAFSPDLIFISAGFDAGKNDVGCGKTENGKYCSGIDLSPEDYEWATQQIRIVAQEKCNGRIISALEGGYGKWSRSKKSKQAQPQTDTERPSRAVAGSAKKLELDRDQLGENAVAHVRSLVH